MKELKMFKKMATIVSACAVALGSLPSWAANQVDVLVLYTPEALQTRYGADIDARIASYITYANQAYANSDVDLQLRLVGSEQMDLPYDTVTSANLGGLRTHSDVAELRRQYGADLVTLLNLREEINYGYVCGIGYMPGGSSHSGQLYSNAASAAFSLVGINCGISTMAHELGHNMSLGHSEIQGNGGGIWPWARGYGVSGLFSTVMAYPQSYGTRNQLQRFSNPAQNDCEGLECGVSHEHSSGADSATNLNRLAAQISEFMPTVVEMAPDDNGDDTAEPDNGDGSTPACAHNEVDGNLVRNGEFQSLEHWASGFQSSRLSQAEVIGDCIDTVLAVTDRSEYYSSAFQSLANPLAAGGRYQFKGRFGIRGGSRENVRIALQIQDGGSTRYSYLDPVSVTSNELTTVSQTFDVTDPVTGLLIYGPQAGVDILMDSLSIVEVSTPQANTSGETVSDGASSAQRVLQEEFEGTANGWSSYYGGSLSYSTDAASGQYSLLSKDRYTRYTGPAINATGAIQANITYQLSTAVRVSNEGGGEESLAVWLYYVDDAGSHWQNVLRTSVTTNGWQTVSGAVSVQPQGELVSVRFNVFGPERGLDLRIDDFIVEQQ